MDGGHKILYSHFMQRHGRSERPSDLPLAERVHHLSAALHLLAGERAADPVFLALGSSIREQGSFQKAVRGLSQADRAYVDTHIGGARLFQLSALEQEADAELFFEQLLSFWQQGQGEADTAARLAGLAWLAETPAEKVPDRIRAKARREHDAILGRGALGPRIEILLKHLSQGATDPRMILPMMGASLLGKLVQGGLLARLLAGSEATWYSRGLGARTMAAFGAFQAESLGFALSHHALSVFPQDSFGAEWARAALGLGAMKLGAGLGLKASGLLSGGGMAQRIGQRLLAPTSVFLGLSMAAQLETHLGLRPPAEPTTLMVDSLASMLALGLGMRLGRQLLGPRWAAFERELDGRLRAMATTPRPSNFAAPAFAVEGGDMKNPSFRPPTVLMSEVYEPKSLAASSSGVMSSAPLRLRRILYSSKGTKHPYDLILETPKGLWRSEGEGLVGETLLIAEREGRPLRLRLEKHERNREGDPIVPEGVQKLHFVLEEGESRGKAFVYVDREAITLYFVDLEETMITQGPPMPAGAGSIFFTWLAEQARLEGKRFNVTRITSPQTVKILVKQNLMDVKTSCVEACNRINPESYDEEYRIEARFALGDEAAWNLHRRQVEFFNVFGGSGIPRPK